MNDGVLYASFNSAQRFDANCAINEFADFFAWRFDGSDTLLDVGCGPGDVLRDFVIPVVPKNLTKVIGIDISCEMVACARNLLKNLEFVDFLQLDISESSDVCRKVLGDVQFSNITSFYCQHWIQDQRCKLLKCRNELLTLEKFAGNRLKTFTIFLGRVELF